MAGKVPYAQFYKRGPALGHSIGSIGSGHMGRMRGTAETKRGAETEDMVAACWGGGKEGDGGKRGLVPCRKFTHSPY